MKRLLAVGKGMAPPPSPQLTNLFIHNFYLYLGYRSCVSWITWFLSRAQSHTHQLKLVTIQNEPIIPGANGSFYLVLLSCLVARAKSQPDKRDPDTQ